MLSTLRLVTALALFQPLAVAGQQADTLSRAARWSDDLRFLAEQLEQKHPKAFHKISKEQFARAALKLGAEAPGFSDTRMSLEVMRLVASLGDAHTSASLNFAALGLKRVPFAAYWFDDGMYIRDADTSLVRLVGARIINVGGLPIDTVIAGLSSFVAHDNLPGIKNGVPGLLPVVDVLQAAGILSRDDSVALTVERSDGMRETVVLAAWPWSRPATFTLPGTLPMDSFPLYRRDGNRAYWFHYIEPESTMYVAYNRATNDANDPIDPFAERLIQAMRERNARRVVVDFRNNAGVNSGYFGSIQRRLLELKAERPELQIVGIIGRRTFSSGMWNALMFRRAAGAKLYGEPTGGKPNHFGEVKSFALPHSKLLISHSTKVWTLLPNEDPPALIPDVVVPINVGDYLRRRDPVLDRVLRRN